MGESFSQLDTNRHAAAHRNSKFVVWEDNLFRRKKRGLKSVVIVEDRGKLLRFLHDSMGHCDLQETRKLLSERYWWPSIQKYITDHVRVCDALQRMKYIPKYVTSIYRLLTNSFEVFTIDFAGLFPK